MEKTTSTSLPAFKFTPWLKTVIWGGDRIADFKHLSDAQPMIGESWEISAINGMESIVSGGPDNGLTLSQLTKKYGTRLIGDTAGPDGKFPLIIKFIDARNDLSVQVHPGDEMARTLHNSPGKTETWYIIDAEPGATILNGFSRDFNPDDYEKAVNNGSIIDAILRHPSSPGNAFFIPAGRIHAIGAGNFLIEVQRASDVTYRVFDYNRIDTDGSKRPLHVENARKALDFKAATDDNLCATTTCEDTGIHPIVNCPYFNVKRIAVEGRTAIDTSNIDSFISVSCIAGDLNITVDTFPKMLLRQGETALIPATAQRVLFRGNAIAITASVPAKQ